MGHKVETIQSFRLWGNQLQIVAPLDFETSPTLTILVQTTDASLRSFTTPLTITVVDMNEHPILEDREFELSENRK